MHTSIVVPGFARPYLEGERLDGSAPVVAQIDGLLSPADCAALIARIEALGPTAAPVTTLRGAIMRPDLRNNERVMFEDVALAEQLFARVEALVPARLAGGVCVGLNERFRGYRYTAGQRFRPHFDGAFVRDAREASRLTLLLYLDEDCAGGETRFLDYDVSVAPRRGRAVWFQHATMHEGAEVRSGCKHVLRTDVMYRRDT